MNRSRKNRNKTSNTRKKVVVYTGINAKKSGRHTIKEFLKVMGRDKKRCTQYIAGKSCVPCAKFNTLVRKIFKRNKTVTRKTIKQYNKYLEACEKCRNKSKTRCTFHDYLEYSGAEFKK